MNRNEYVRRPNLLRVATEISKRKNPDRMLETVKLILKGSLNDFTDSEKNVGLLIGEVITVLDKPH